MFRLSLLKTLFAVVLTICSTALYADTATPVATTPASTNTSAITNELKQYYKSGSYNHEIIQVSNQALLYLIERVNLNKKMDDKQELAIVLDIDETSLSNYPFLAKHNFQITPEQFQKHIADANDHAILPILALYDFAHSNGVAIFFVTGRPENLRDATIKNLRNVGYNNNWTGIYFRPADYKDLSIQPYKANSRKEIAAKGYTIIFTMGDQQSDLDGGFAEKTFKVPNPFYNIP